MPNMEKRGMNAMRALADPEPTNELPFEMDIDGWSDVSTQQPPALIGAEFCIAKADGVDYVVQAPNGTVRLERDVDFGVIQGVKTPSLFKAGAEKIAVAYGLLQHYTIEKAVEEFFGETPLCFYRVRCDLVKIGPNGQEYIIATGLGSANTSERRNGRNDVFNSANSTLKMAAKRSLVAAAISVSSVSGLFSQDLENENFVNENIAALTATNNPDAPITRKQMNLLYAKAGNLGMTAPQAKKAMADAGFPSVKGLTQRDYSKVLELFETPAEREAREAQRGE